MKPSPHHRLLMRLASLPTAAGCEHRVAAFVRRWVRRRPTLAMRADRFGNLVIRRRGRPGGRCVMLTAHMDHPAFVVEQVLDERRLLARFRGGVSDSFFVGSAVQLHPTRGPAAPGVVRELTVIEKPSREQQCTIELERPAGARVGDVITWRLPAADVRDGRLHAPACDDLAGAAAALAAMDVLLRCGPRTWPDVRILLTRAEEVGFLGAIAACRAGTLPRGARVVALETSRSYADSPIGGGPIVRVGDRTSTFDPDLTWQVSRIAEELARADAGFRFQRKLMPGGTCEATAYQALGHRATCVCLPLGHYHNMNADTGRIDSETISLADFDALVQLLTALAAQLADADPPRLAARLNQRFEAGRHILQPLSPPARRCARPA